MHKEHKNTMTQNKLNQLKPRLDASYDLWPGNGVGLFSKEKVSKEVDKWGKISKEKRNKWGKPSKQTVYIAPKSTNESRMHYSLEPARSRLVWKEVVKMEVDCWLVDVGHLLVVNVACRSGSIHHVASKYVKYLCRPNYSTHTRLCSCLLVKYLSATDSNRTQLIASVCWMRPQRR